jgi:hypothetical protein
MRRTVESNRIATLIATSTLMALGATGCGSKSNPAARPVKASSGHLAKDSTLKQLPGVKTPLSHAQSPEEPQINQRPSKNETRTNINVFADLCGNSRLTAIVHKILGEPFSCEGPVPTASHDFPDGVVANDNTWTGQSDGNIIRVRLADFSRDTSGEWDSLKSAADNDSSYPKTTIMGNECGGFNPAYTCFFVGNRALSLLELPPNAGNQADETAMIAATIEAAGSTN